MSTEPHMSAELSALRVYLIAGDRMDGRPAAEVLLQAADSLGASLAFARTGVAGFGRHGLEVDLLLLESMPERMPITVQILGAESTLLDLLETMQARGLPNRTVVLEAGVALLRRAPQAGSA